MASASSVISDSIEDPSSQPPSQSSQSSNQPRLSLQIDTPPSSSPFPSPSSSFLPPPMPGAHEFAAKPPPQGKTKRGSKADLALGTGSVIANGEEKQENGLGELRALSPATPTNKSTFLVAAVERTSSPLSSPPADTFPDSPLTTPTPITPAPNSSPNSTSSATKRSSYEPSHPNPHRISIPILQSTRDANPNPSPNPSNQRPESTSSLTSTRPAPPSPAMSRRASGAPSTTSNRSRSSRPSSTSTSQLPGTLSRNPSTRKSSRLSQSMSPQQSSPPQQRQEPQQKKRRSLLVKIKDFAFASTDDRHAGLGADVPKPNRVRVLNRFHRSRTASNGSHLSVSSIGTEEDGDGEDEDGEGGGLGDDGWGGFKWGFGRFSSWGFGRGGAGGRSDNSGEGSSISSASFPSKTDFARNFGEEAEEPDTYVYQDDDEDDDEDDEDERDYYDLGCGGGSPHAPEEDEPLYSGLYRALYAFEPEGTAEMKLEEDQVVRVIGRGGGVGWAVVDRGGAGGHALVPESYLEVVRLDEDVVGAGDAGA